LLEANAMADQIYFDSGDKEKGEVVDLAMFSASDG